jgi:predicted DNA-binding transcriptional regulator AlpA
LNRQTDAAPVRAFDPPALAKILKLHPDTLRRWRREGRGPRFVTIGPRTIRYLFEAVEEWLANTEAKNVTGGGA